MRTFVSTREQRFEVEEGNTSFTLDEVVFIEKDPYVVSQVKRIFLKAGDKLFETQEVTLNLTKPVFDPTA